MYQAERNILLSTHIRGQQMVTVRRHNQIITHRHDSMDRWLFSLRLSLAVGNILIIPGPRSSIYPSVIQIHAWMHL